MTPTAALDWRANAACAGHGPDPWFDRDDPAPALAICAACPVRADCLDDALARGETRGIWGGRALWPTDTDRRSEASQTAVAGIIGIHQAALSAWLRGETRPAARSAAAFRAALDDLPEDWRPVLAAIADTAHPPTRPCGTPAALSRHRYHGERCDECRDAENARRRQGRQAS